MNLHTQCDKIWQTTEKVERAGKWELGKAAKLPTSFTKLLSLPNKFKTLSQSE